MISALQAEVDVVQNYQERVKVAKVKFGSKPKPLFDRVRVALAEACGDLVRCGYCEDSCADEVEHLWPKDFYPNFTFVHENYLFSCGRCNPKKGNKFSIWVDDAWLDLQSQRKSGIFVEPAAGVSRFISPLTEAPLELLWLDIDGGTFYFVATADEGSLEYDRAEFTIQTLGLNRGFLAKARENAYSGFLDRMHMYIGCKESGGTQGELDRRIWELRRCPHQTVRHEIARQIGVTILPPDTVARCPELFLDE
ncbi:hypothetical protein [Pseudogemmobacter sp. W21_MBD1_M6]|uniref:hypothetical protein n=1 Tax=Pseudogemmobacter sp. W21_MBD1_M6 TaxID=3240271 RepID=UPI003F94D0ED